MSPLARLGADRDRALNLAAISALIGIVAIAISIVLFYAGKDRETRHEAQQAKAQTAALQAAVSRIQNGLCGSQKRPGLLVTIATAPPEVSRSHLGYLIVDGARLAKQVIECPQR